MYQWDYVKHLERTILEYENKEDYIKENIKLKRTVKKQEEEIKRLKDHVYRLSRGQKKGVPSTLKNKTKERDGYKCVKCGYEDELHVHHIISVSQGGVTELDNLETICVYCHYYEHLGTPQANLLYANMKHKHRVKKR